MLRIHFNNLFKVVKFNYTAPIIAAFCKIKRFYVQTRVNKMKAKIIFQNFSKNLNKILFIYGKMRKKTLTKGFLRYRKIVFIRNKLMKLKNEIDMNFEKKKEKEIYIVESKIKEKEKEISENKKQLEINVEYTNEINKKLKQFEENFTIFTQNFKKIEVNLK